MNKNLHKTKKEKDDEYYTQLSDVEKEIGVYLSENPNLFKGKNILLPCDSWERSMFSKYFLDNFESLGLSGLLSVSKNLDEGGQYHLTQISELGVKETQTGYLELGGFEDKFTTKKREWADFIITNPPSSRFRDFIDWISYGANIKPSLQFLILGNMNAITYKNVYSRIQSNELWLGKNNGSKTYQLPCGGSETLGNTYWFTNIPHDGIREWLPTTKEYTPYRYPRYDNYDGVEVSRTADIPADYSGVMGVPISFLSKYNPSQFEIIGFRKGEDGKDLSVGGRDKYFRVLIKYKT